eukprot:693256-Prorocentrum_minimum.AAC.9
MVSTSSETPKDSLDEAPAVKKLVNHLALVTEELRVCKRKLDIYLEKKSPNEDQDQAPKLVDLDLDFVQFSHSRFEQDKQDFLTWATGTDTDKTKKTHAHDIALLPRHRLLAPLPMERFGIIVKHPFDRRPQEERIGPVFSVNHNVRVCHLLDRFRRYLVPRTSPDEEVELSDDFTVEGLRFDAWKLLNMNAKMTTVETCDRWTMYDANDEDRVQQEGFPYTCVPLNILRMPKPKPGRKPLRNSSACAASIQAIFVLCVPP